MSNNLAKRMKRNVHLKIRKEMRKEAKKFNTFVLAIMKEQGIPRDEAIKVAHDYLMDLRKQDYKAELNERWLEERVSPTPVTDPIPGETPAATPDVSPIPVK